MDVKLIQNIGRGIWGDQKHTLDEIVVRMGVTFGDICRLAREGVPPVQLGETRGKKLRRDELRKELGNMIVSTIRWCDDLSLDIHECIDLAIECQNKFVKKHGDKR